MLENKILATFDTGVTYYLRLLIIFLAKKEYALYKLCCIFLRFALTRHDILRSAAIW